jgi:hypothetical protein
MTGLKPTKYWLSTNPGLQVGVINVGTYPVQGIIYEQLLESKKGAVHRNICRNAEKRRQ